MLGEGYGETREAFHAGWEVVGADLSSAKPEYVRECQRNRLCAHAHAYSLIVVHVVLNIL